IVPRCSPRTNSPSAVATAGSARVSVVAVATAEERPQAAGPYREDEQERPADEELGGPDGDGTGVGETADGAFGTPERGGEDDIGRTTESAYGHGGTEGRTGQGRHSRLEPEDDTGSGDAPEYVQDHAGHLPGMGEGAAPVRAGAVRAERCSTPCWR